MPALAYLAGDSSLRHRNRAVPANRHPIVCQFHRLIKHLLHSAELPLLFYQTFNQFHSDILTCLYLRARQRVTPCWYNVLHYPHSSRWAAGASTYPATSGLAQSYRSPSRFISIVSPYNNGAPFHGTYFDLPRAAIKSASESSRSRARYAHQRPPQASLFTPYL